MDNWRDELNAILIANGFAEKVEALARTDLTNALTPKGKLKSSNKYLNNFQHLTDGYVIFGLISDYLAFLHLDFTLDVFLAETESTGSVSRGDARAMIRLIRSLPRKLDDLDTGVDAMINFYEENNEGSCEDLLELLKERLNLPEFKEVIRGAGADPEVMRKAMKGSFDLRRCRDEKEERRARSLEKREKPRWYGDSKVHPISIRDFRNKLQSTGGGLGQSFWEHDLSNQLIPNNAYSIVNNATFDGSPVNNATFDGPAVNNATFDGPAALNATFDGPAAFNATFDGPAAINATFERCAADGTFEGPINSTFVGEAVDDCSPEMECSLERYRTLPGGMVDIMALIEDQQDHEAMLLSENRLEDLKEALAIDERMDVKVKSLGPSIVVKQVQMRQNAEGQCASRMELPAEISIELFEDEMGWMNMDDSMRSTEPYYPRQICSPQQTFTEPQNNYKARATVAVPVIKKRATFVPRMMICEEDEEEESNSGQFSDDQQECEAQPSGSPPRLIRKTTAKWYEAVPSTSRSEIDPPTHSPVAQAMSPVRAAASPEASPHRKYAPTAGVPMAPSTSKGAIPKTFVAGRRRKPSKKKSTHYDCRSRRDHERHDVSSVQNFNVTPDVITPIIQVSLENALSADYDCDYSHLGAVGGFGKIDADVLATYAVPASCPSHAAVESVLSGNISSAPVQIELVISSAEGCDETIEIPVACDPKKQKNSKDHSGSQNRALKPALSKKQSVGGGLSKRVTIRFPIEIEENKASRKGRVFRPKTEQKSLCYGGLASIPEEPRRGPAPTKARPRVSLIDRTIAHGAAAKERLASTPRFKRPSMQRRPNTRKVLSAAAPTRSALLQPQATAVPGRKQKARPNSLAPPGQRSQALAQRARSIESQRIRKRMESAPKLLPRNVSDLRRKGACTSAQVVARPPDDFLLGKRLVKKPLPDYLGLPTIAHGDVRRVMEAAPKLRPRDVSDTRKRFGCSTAEGRRPSGWRSGTRLDPMQPLPNAMSMPRMAREKVRSVMEADPKLMPRDVSEHRKVFGCSTAKPFKREVKRWR